MGNLTIEEVKELLKVITARYKRMYPKQPGKTRTHQGQDFDEMLRAMKGKVQVEEG